LQTLKVIDQVPRRQRRCDRVRLNIPDFLLQFREWGKVRQHVDVPRVVVLRLAGQPHGNLLRDADIRIADEDGILHGWCPRHASNPP